MVIHKTERKSDEWEAARGKADVKWCRRDFMTVLRSDA